MVFNTPMKNEKNWNGKCQVEGMFTLMGTLFLKYIIYKYKKYAYKTKHRYDVKFTSIMELTIIYSFDKLKNT